MSEQDYSLNSKIIGALPIVNRFIKRMDLYSIFNKHVPQLGDAKISHAEVILVLIRSICIERHPVYKLAEWASPFDSKMLGLRDLESKVLNDDKVGRTIDALFDADRATLMTEIVLKMVSEFNIDLSQLHNDSTSVTFAGRYEAPRDRRKKKALLITEGHNKDHRPDLKQLVFSLSVSRDGAVPIHFKTYDGNRTDDSTHIETWQTLNKISGRSDFIYVADCKLCTQEQMGYISDRNGRFITILPRTRSEDKWFKEWIQSHHVDWQELLRRPCYRKTPLSRLGIESVSENIYWGFESPVPSREGYRIIWIMSSQRRDQDARSRQKKIERTIEALERLKKKLGTRGKLKTQEQITEAVVDVLKKFQTVSLIKWKHVVREIEDFQQEGMGRPGKTTKYIKRIKQIWGFEAMPDEGVIQRDAAEDGLFPLITNIPSTELSMKEILQKYKYQPYLEKRHEQFKDVLDVAPVYLKLPHRVEALMFTYFVALILHALIERETRVSMSKEKLNALPLYPEARKCKSPGTERILEIFSNQRRNELRKKEAFIKTFFDPLNSLQEQILRFLDVNASEYKR